jgi:conflict system pore-forming effector with SLATT domain
MSDANPIDLDQEPLGREEIDALYKIYMDKRIAAQISFYESRMRENQYNADFTFTLGALVMTVSSLVATVSASGGSSFLALISAILPAFAALLGSFRQLYGWERQTNIYRDSLLGLERVKLIVPDDDRLPASDLVKIYPELVSSSETVFTGEVNQWGQFIQEKEKGEEGETTDSNAMTTLMGDLHLSD